MLFVVVAGTWFIIWMAIASPVLTFTVIVITGAVTWLVYRPVVDILYLNGYNSLYDKYHDNSSLTEQEHDTCVKYYKQCLREMLENREFKKWAGMKKAYKNNDWDTIYEAMLEWYEVEDVDNF